MDSDFPSRCGSSMSLASQGTSYSSLLGEDLSEVIANASFDEEYITSERQPAKIAVELGKRKRTEEHFYRSLGLDLGQPLSHYLHPAHSFRLSPFISRLPWGAQWEIARQLCAIGTNATAAPEVAKLVRSKCRTAEKLDAFTAMYAQERAARLPWDELDHEESVLTSSPYGGLGCNADEDFCAGHPDCLSEQCPRQPRDCSLLDFITWHNNLILNDGQTMVKWAARFALGTSNSVPGVRLEPDNIRFVDDIVCDGYSGKGKVPSEMIMTDGCGFANRALLQSLQAKFRWPIEPTAVQIRIGGAKGLLLLHLDRVADHDGSSEVPTIWLRPSQTKIKHSHLPLSQCLLPKESDPAILTVDVLRASRLTSPARLSVETIINLAENGVPFKVFVTLLTESMRTKAESFLQFDGPDGDLLLWANVAREGGVISARLAREVAGAARAHGYTFEDATEEDGDDDDLEQLDKALQERSTAWWRTKLAAKLKEVAKKSIRSFATRFRIVVPMSCSAFIVPDPYGVLGPNEVHIRSLVAISWTKKAGRLISFSERSWLHAILARSRPTYKSMTGGGDYDGDTMEIRRGASERQHSLVKNTETVAEFLTRVPESAPAETQMYELQKYLLGALQDTSIVGTYSTWWENTIYKLGYAHEQTIFLAYMFCAVLDGSKTGVSVDRRTLESHRKQYAHRPPSWKETSEELKRKCFLESNEPNLKRSKELPRFIMDELRNVVERESSNLLSNIEKKLGIKAVLDAHLAARGLMRSSALSSWLGSMAMGL
ncbi:hypothetical protein A0H81_02409 [Grifola frondosa]|uniref:RNA-dependent RNA polymerase n=1 Tax=Grifola frondosa TaxID=5627 RepID=A0A1C7MLQ4_GRIFR|nr:hypothetical protein A0H81_02409 [Grifola frondosa]